MKRGIVLIGMAGVGKSTVGLALARALGWDFLDLDAYLSAREGQTPQQIIDHRGEMTLLRLEKQRMQEIDLRRKVVAPGGSIIYDAELMAYLKQSACLVYLEDALENIVRRLGNMATRGIVGLQTKTLAEIYRERTPLYARYADLTVNVAGKSKAQVVAEIAAAVRRAACQPA